MKLNVYQRLSAWFLFATIIGTSLVGFGIHWIIGTLVLSIWCGAMAYACHLCAKDEEKGAK